MPHSTVTRKGQTTIPGKIRKAWRIKPGDKLEYVVPFYEHQRGDIASALGSLISSPGVEIADTTLHLDALELSKSESSLRRLPNRCDHKNGGHPGRLVRSGLREFNDVRVEIE